MGKLYYGKHIAIDIDTTSLVTIGESFKDVNLQAKNKRSNHKIVIGKMGVDF